MEELAHVGGLEAELDHGVDGPGQDGVLVERVELATEAGDPAPQAGPVLVFDGRLLTEHELFGELHGDEVSGAGGGDHHAEAQDQGGRADGEADCRPG